MKGISFKLRSLGLASLVLFCVFVSAGQAVAEGYLGEFCWSFSNPINEISATLQVGVTHIGGNHYLCSGRATILPTATTPTWLLDMRFPTYGNIEIIGGEIYMTLSIPGTRNTALEIDMLKARLDPTTLNGTFEYIGVSSYEVELSQGTLTHTTCQ